MYYLHVIDKANFIVIIQAGWLVGAQKYVNVFIDFVIQKLLLKVSEGISQ